MDGGGVGGGFLPLVKLKLASALRTRGAVNGTPGPVCRNGWGFLGR